MRASMTRASSQIVGVVLIYAVSTLWLRGALQLVDLALAVPLVWLTVEDLRKTEIPNLATVAVAAVGVLVLATAPADQILVHGLGAAAVWAGFWAIGEAIFRWSGQEGLGQGDAKLFAAGTLLLGLAALPMLVLLASCGGIAAVLLARSRGAVDRSAIPFGPFIGYAIYILFLTG
ncbi:MAG: hypothetical protein N838_11960 [Thiohalocapsa sp. PB-PSB1]|nr:MAG: hypothetical protein N838_11960 [Thiohalocapsa sp. PB-PSB1]